MPTQTIEVLRIPGTLFPRGPFDENADYKFLNFVESGGNGYVCLQPCTGIPVTNTAYWFKFVFKGDKGDAFTYADLTAEQKAELVRDATAAAQAAASSAQSAADDAAAALQKFNTIKAAIDAIDPQSTEGSIQTLAAKQGLLEADLNALGPELYKEESLELTTSSNNLTINTTTWVIQTTTGTQKCYYAAVNTGDKLHITASNSSAKGFRYGFAQSVPAENVALTGAGAANESNIDVNLVAPYNGYIILSHSKSYFEDHVVNVRKSRVSKVEADVAYTKEVVEGISYVELKYNTSGGKRIASDGTLAESTVTSFVLLSADVSNYIGKTLYLSGVLPATSGSGTTYCWFTFLDSNGSVVLKSDVSGSNKVEFNQFSVIVPEGASILYVFGTTAVKPNAIIRINDAVSISASTTSYKTISIEPLMTFDVVRGTTGDFSTNPNIANVAAVASVRFIKVNGEFSVSSSLNGTLYVHYYDSSFGYLGNTNETLTANTEVSISLAYTNCAYIKLCMYAGVGKLARLTLTGKFDDKWDVFNPRPSDDGYHRISVLVNVTNPTCCDNESSSVQDSRQLLADYGVICLPPTYRQEGEPTRLIIYCHGAAVNYSDDATRFNTQDLEPEYWLSEGYAVMDIEGNPFNNTDEHMSMPQSIDCYIAGYKWAIEHYNLKRDGVFLGGRSMGGGQTIALMRRECPIPIIAACPNVPSPAMPFGAIAARKSFYATHLGFTLPSGFSFTDGYVNSEKQVWFDNLDKWIKSIPAFSLITDLPINANDKQELTEKLLLGNVDGRNDYLKSFHGFAKCPVKFFACNQDVGPMMWADVCYRILLNSAQMTEIRLFNSEKDYSGTGTSAHHYDTQDPALRASVVTKYGEELTNIPIVYIEMLQFWRRFEQGM